MFEGWAADMVAAYLGKFVDVQRDQLRISLWSGRCVLDNVRLRPDALDHLQLPFQILEGRVGRLELGIPWGRWTGGPLVIRLRDVTLRLGSRDDADWEEGPALRRAQAAKQAQLAAAELAKLGKRVTGDGGGGGGGGGSAASSGEQQKGAGGGGGGGKGGSVVAAGVAWGTWSVVDLVGSFLLNRLQFSVENVHLSFEAVLGDGGAGGERVACGLQLRSLSTLPQTPVGADPNSRLGPFTAGRPQPVNPRIVRELAVDGWAIYWRPPEAVRSAAAARSRPSSSTAAAAAPPAPAASDYIVPPIDTVMRIVVRAGDGDADGSGGSGTGSEPPAAAAIDVLIGVTDAAVQVSADQITGLAALADAAAIWDRRNRYGRFRPPGWRTVGQLPGGWAALGSSAAAAADSSGAAPRLVPTARAGVGPAVTWQQVWRYAISAVQEEQRAKRARQLGSAGVLAKRDGPARRRYMDLYRRRLEQLQDVQQQADVQQSSDSDTTAAAAAVVTPPGRSTADDTAAAGRSQMEEEGAAVESGAAAEALVQPPAVAAAPPTADRSRQPLTREEERELQLLELRLGVTDILLARSLAEAAIDRQNGSDTERRRSWFAWGAAALSSFNPYSGASTTAGSGSKRPPGPAVSFHGAPGVLLPGGLPTDSDLEGLHALLDGGHEEGLMGSSGGDGGNGSAAKPRRSGKRGGGGGGGGGVQLSFELWLLSVSAALRGAAGRSIAALHLTEAEAGAAVAPSGRVRARLAVSDLALVDCCSDPGVEETVLGRLDRSGPLARLADLRAPPAGPGPPPPLLAVDIHVPPPRVAAAGDVPSPEAPLCSVDARVQALQLVGRPACLAAVIAVIDQAPTDTLERRLQAAAAEMRREREARTAGAGSAGEDVDSEKGAAVPAGQVAAPPPDLALMASVALSFSLTELVVLAPEQLHYLGGTHALLHVRGVRVTPVDEPMGASTPGGAGSSGLFSSPRAAAPPPCYSTHRLEVDCVALRLGGGGGGPARPGPVVAQLPPIHVDASLMRRPGGASGVGPDASVAEASAAPPPFVVLRISLPEWQLSVRTSQVAALQWLFSSMAQQAEDHKQRQLLEAAALHQPPAPLALQQVGARPAGLAAPLGSPDSPETWADAADGRSLAYTSPTKSEIERWLAQPPPADLHPDGAPDSPAAPVGAEGAGAAVVQLPSPAAVAGGPAAAASRGAPQPQQQQQRKPQSRVPRGPPATWLAVEVVTEQLTIEVAVDDSNSGPSSSIDSEAKPGPPPAAFAPRPPAPSIHARAAITALRLHHSSGTHGEALRVAVRGLEVTDLIEQPPAAASLQRLARSVSAGEVTFSMSRRIYHAADAAASGAAGGWQEERGMAVEVEGLELRGFENACGVFLLPSRRGAPARGEYRSSFRRWLGGGVSSGAARSTHVAVRGLAIGADIGIWIAAAIEALKAGGSKKHGGADDGTEAPPPPPEQQEQQQQPQEKEKEAAGKRQPVESALSVVVEHCQVLAVAADAGSSGSAPASLVPPTLQLAPPLWRTASPGLSGAFEPSAAGLGLGPGGAVSCQALLEIPLLSVCSGAGSGDSAPVGEDAATPAPRRRGQRRRPERTSGSATPAGPLPLVELRGLALLLAESPTSDFLVPALRVPLLRVLRPTAAGGASTALEALLVQVPAIAAAVRPGQVVLIGEVAAAKASLWQRWAPPPRPQQPRPPGAKAAASARPPPPLGPPGPIDLEVGRVAVGVIPEPGGADSGVLLQWRRIAVRYSGQQSGEPLDHHQQHQQQQQQQQQQPGKEESDSSRGPAAQQDAPQAAERLSVALHFALLEARLVAADPQGTAAGAARVHALALPAVCALLRPGSAASVGDDGAGDDAFYDARSLASARTPSSMSRFASARDSWQSPGLLSGSFGAGTSGGGFYSPHSGVASSLAASAAGGLAGVRGVALEPNGSIIAASWQLLGTSPQGGSLGGRAASLGGTGAGSVRAPGRSRSRAGTGAGPPPPYMSVSHSVRRGSGDGEATEAEFFSVAGDSDGDDERSAAPLFPSGGSFGFADDGGALPLASLGAGDDELSFVELLGGTAGSGGGGAPGLLLLAIKAEGPQAAQEGVSAGVPASESPPRQQQQQEEPPYSWASPFAAAASAAATTADEAAGGGQEASRAAVLLVSRTVRRVAAASEAAASAPPGAAGDKTDRPNIWDIAVPHARGDGTPLPQSPTGAAMPQPVPGTPTAEAESAAASLALHLLHVPPLGPAPATAAVEAAAAAAAALAREGLVGSEAGAAAGAVAVDSGGLGRSWSIGSSLYALGLPRPAGGSTGPENSSAGPGDGVANKGTAAPGSLVVATSVELEFARWQLMVNAGDWDGAAPCLVQCLQAAESAVATATQGPTADGSDASGADCPTASAHQETAAGGSDPAAAAAGSKTTSSSNSASISSNVSGRVVLPELDIILCVPAVGAAPGDPAPALRLVTGAELTGSGAGCAWRVTGAVRQVLITAGAAAPAQLEACFVAPLSAAASHRQLPSSWLELACLKRLEASVSSAAKASPGTVRLVCHLGSVSAWVTPARTALLLRLQRHAEAQIVAVAAEAAAASALAAPVPYEARRARGAGAGSGSGGKGAAAAAASGVVVALDVSRIAVLCSVDEDAPGPAAPTAVPARGTPVVEVALTALRLRLASRRRGLSLRLQGSLQANVYSVDKLGWEPAVEPWGFQVSLAQSTPPGGKPATQVSLSSPSLLQATVGPSAILATAQLQLMAVGASAATDSALAAFAAAGESEGCSNGGGGSGSGCWLVNETGAALSFFLGDASTTPAAAAARIAAAAAGGGGDAGTVGVAGPRRPVALRARDPVTARFGGQWVEYPDPGAGEECGAAAAVDNTAAAAADAARGGASGGGGLCLFLQLPGQRGVLGPVPLRDHGASLHTLQDAGGAGSGPRAQTVVCDVRPHRYGSSLVSVHSCVELLNDTSVPLQLGALSPLALEPTPVAQLAPGQCTWLPLGLLAATTPALCLRPAPPGGAGGAADFRVPSDDGGVPAFAAASGGLGLARPGHGWCRPVDVNALLVPAWEQQPANRGAFWYCPPSARAAQRVIHFPPSAGGSAALLGAGAGGGAISNASSYAELRHYFPSEPVLGHHAVLQHTQGLGRTRGVQYGSSGAFSTGSVPASEASGSQPVTPQWGAGGGRGGLHHSHGVPLMVCLGASPLPAPAGAAAAAAASGMTAPGASPEPGAAAAAGLPSPQRGGPGAAAPAAPRLWRLRASPPLVVSNNLPVPLDVGFAASARGAHFEARLSEATIAPGQQLQLYDLEPQSYHRLQITPLGFHPAAWITLPGGAAALASSAAAAVHGGGDDGTGGGSSGSVATPGTDEKDGSRSVVLAPVALDQPSEVVQVSWATAPGSGALSVNVGCALWVYNHTGMPLGLRQVANAPAVGPLQQKAAAAAQQPSRPLLPPLPPPGLSPTPAGGSSVGHGSPTTALSAASVTGAAAAAAAAAQAAGVPLLPAAAALAAASVTSDGAGSAGSGHRRPDLLSPPVLWVAPAPQASAVEPDADVGSAIEDHRPPARSSISERDDGGRGAALPAHSLGSVQRAPSPPTRGAAAAAASGGSHTAASRLTIVPPPSPSAASGVGPLHSVTAATPSGGSGLASLAGAPSFGLLSPSYALPPHSGLLPSASGRREPAVAAAAAAAAAVAGGTAARPPGPALHRRSRSAGSMHASREQSPDALEQQQVQAAAAARPQRGLAALRMGEGSPARAPSPPLPPPHGGPAAALGRVPSVASQDGAVGLSAASISGWGAVPPAPASLASSSQLAPLRTRRGLASGASAARLPWPALLGLPKAGEMAAAASPPLELQLCAAPAVAAAAVARGIPSAPSGRPLTVPTACWSSSVQLPLRPLRGSGPPAAAVVKLPYPAGGGGAAAQSSAAAGAGAAAATQGVAYVSLQLQDLPHDGPGPAPCVLRILPTYQLLNLLPFEVQLRQAGTEQALQSATPGGPPCGVLWADARLPLKLQLRAAEPGWSWTGGAAMDAPGESILKMRHRSRGETLLVRLEVSASRAAPGGALAVLRAVQEGSAFAPYRIDNCSGETLHVQQVGCLDEEDVLPPYSCLPYTWDEPSQPNKVLLLLPGHRTLGTFALEELGDKRVVQLPAGGGRRGRRQLEITTQADGPTRVLRVVDISSHPATAAAGSATGAAASEGASLRAAPTGQTLVQQLRAVLPQPAAADDAVGSTAAEGQAGPSSAPTAAAAAAAAGGPSLNPGTTVPRDGQGLGGEQGEAEAAAAAGASFARAGRPPWLLDLRVQLRGAALSLVSDSQELLFAAPRGLAVRLLLDPVRVRGAFALDSLRVENTLHGAQYPLMLASPVKPSVFGVTLEGGSGDAVAPDGAAAALGTAAAAPRPRAPAAAPALGVLCTLWRDRPGGVLCFERLGVHIAPLAVSLEGLHLKALLDLGAAMQAAAARHGLTRQGVSTGGRRAAAAALPEPPAQLAARLARSKPLKLYFEDWYISPLQLCITFAPGSWFAPPAAAQTPEQLATAAAAALGGSSAAAGASGSGPPGVVVHGAARPNSRGAPDDASAAGGPAAAAGVPLPVWAQMAVALAHTEGAWLTLGAFHERHPLLGLDAIVQVLGRHYVMAAYQEFPKIVASLDILGDPARVLHSLGLGFWHLITLPAFSASRGPLRSLQKLSSNARGVAFAVSNSLTKGSRRTKAALLPLAPPGLGWYGGGEGRDVLHTLVAGYSLILQAALRSAAAGVQRGRPVRGTLGAAAAAALRAAVLPLLVALEVAESAAGSVRALAAEGQGDGGALRVPRHVDPRSLLRPYDPLESLGRALLYHSPSGAPFKQDGFIGCVPVGPPAAGLFAVVTTEHLLVLAARPARGGGGPVFRRPALQQLLSVGDVLDARTDGATLRLLCVPPWQRSRLHPAIAPPAGSAAAAAAATAADGGGGGGSQAVLRPLGGWIVGCSIDCGRPEAAARLRELLLVASRGRAEGRRAATALMGPPAAPPAAAASAAAAAAAAAATNP